MFAVWHYSVSYWYFMLGIMLYGADLAHRWVYNARATAARLVGARPRGAGHVADARPPAGLVAGGCGCPPCGTWFKLPAPRVRRARCFAETPPCELPHAPAGRAALNPRPTAEPLWVHE
jgi:hypothetical protein